MKKFAALLAGIAMMAAGSAWAVPLTLTLNDNLGNVVTIVDGGAGDTLPATVGAINFNGAVGNWIINLTTGLSGFGGGTPQVDLNSVDFTSSGGHLTITLSDIILGAWSGPGATSGVGGTSVGKTRFNSSASLDMPFTLFQS